jgi:hypothetical protein
MGLMLAILLCRKDPKSGRRLIRNTRMFSTQNQIVWFCQPIKKAWLFFAADLPRGEATPLTKFLARNINHGKKRPKLGEMT